MMRVHRWIRPALLAAGGVLLAALPSVPPAASQTFGESADVVAVEVPVQVVRDGQPVRGLSAADFEVYEGRKKQAITGFEVVDLASPAAPGEKHSAASRRNFLMLFDLSYSEPPSIVKARLAARDVVLKKLHPSDLVAVATYTASKGPQLALGFTSDRRQIEAALDTLGLPQLVDRSPDPLRLVLESNRPSSGAVRTGGRAEEVVLAELEENTERRARADKAAETQRVTALSRSLADLGKLMGTVKGRKYVVYLSEGFDSSLLVGSTDTEELERINRSSESGEIWNIDNDVRFGSTKLGNELERMFEEFRRADCAIQAVDIGGLRGQGNQGAVRPSGQDGLFAMAQQTGGELYRNFNDLSEAMGQMLTKTSVTYVLAFQPEVKRDGGFHKLRVELKNAPRGTRVVHRPGYYAPKPFAQQDPMARVLDAGQAILAGEESGDFPAAVLAAPFQSAGEKAYVPVVIEVDGKGLLAGHQGDVLPAEVYAYALAASGGIEDFFAQTLGLDLKKVQGTLGQTGLKFFGHLELPPGEYSLRVLARNGKTGASALRVVPLVVPAFTSAKPALLPPFFPEPAGKWLMVRENPRGEQREAPYPFLQNQQPYVPASRPVLAAGQEAAVSLVAYNLPDGEVKAKAQVLGADGKERAGGELKLSSRERGGPGTPDRIAASFRPAGLPPGEYQLRVSVAGGDATADAAPLRFVVR